jgi:hypothetical protein
MGLAGCAGPQIDRKAEDILVTAVNKLAGADQLTIGGRRTIAPGFIEGIQAPGSAEITVMVGSADRLAAHIVGTAGERKVYYDGDSFTIYGVASNVYATVPAPPTIDELLDKMNQKFGFSPPLAEFFMNDPYERLTRNVLTGTYVGIEYLGRTRFHHLAFTEAERDWELWVAESDGLPARMLVVAKKVAGEPALQSEIVTIDLDADHPDEVFEFVPPAGATKALMIDLAAD